MPPSWKYERAGILLLAYPIDRTNFPRILNPAGQRGQQYPQLALGPVPNIDIGVGYPVVRTTFSHMATPSSCTPGFSIKRTFPEHWPRGPGTHRTRPWTLPGSLGMYRCWGHPGDHRSPVPIYPLGFIKTNFPRIPENIFILISRRN